MKKVRSKIYQTHIDNQNQEAFIVIIMNYKLPIFLLYLLCKILFFKKKLTLRIKYSETFQ